jgi:hypothetical protein
VPATTWSTRSTQADDAKQVMDKARLESGAVLVALHRFVEGLIEVRAILVSRCRSRALEQRLARTDCVGGKDREYGPHAVRVAAAARVAGMTVTSLRFPGGHSWMIATEALQAALPVIAARAHLISAAPFINRASPGTIASW